MFSSSFRSLLRPTASAIKTSTTAGFNTRLAVRAFNVSAIKSAGHGPPTLQGEVSGGGADGLRDTGWDGGGENRVGWLVGREHGV
jgi:hypothetical protein